MRFAVFHNHPDELVRRNYVAVVSCYKLDIVRHRIRGLATEAHPEPVLADEFLVAVTQTACPFCRSRWIKGIGHSEQVDVGS